MKTLLAAILALTAFNSASFAQPAAPAPDCCANGQPVGTPVAAATTTTTTTTTTNNAPGLQQEPPQVAALQPDTQTSASDAAGPADDDGWHRPVGRRFMHGFRIGWTYVYHMDRVTDTRHDEMGNPTSLKDKYDLKSPNMMLLGYEGFYRIVGHSWLNVLIVGNVTVAGLEQSKFIPAASGLIGFEFDRAFQLGVGVNVTPDPDAPSHMIAAAGWTPMVGSIQTPLHFFIVPDTDGNHRMGATVGMSW